MKLARRTSYFAVLDEVLSAQEFQHLGRFMAEEDYAFVHATGWFRTYRLEDGNPLEGPTYLSQALNESQVDRAWPTGKAIDGLIVGLDALLDDFQDIVGTRERDWLLYTARPFLYPRGTGLSWHNDQDTELPRSGAFAFYTHPEWRPSWGGELLVAPPGGGRDLGNFIVPLPNRLVLVRAGIEHAIRPVHSAAGEAIRTSVAGFFLRLRDAGTENDPYVGA